MFMIVGIGSDVVNIDRISSLHMRYGNKFLERIYTTNEIIHYNSKKSEKNKIAYLARRFAAKEAFAKALGTGFGAHIAFRDVEVSNDENGKPYIMVLKDGVVSEGTAIHVSMSDDYPVAIAYVVIERL